MGGAVGGGTGGIPSSSRALISASSRLPNRFSAPMSSRAGEPVRATSGCMCTSDSSTVVPSFCVRCASSLSVYIPVESSARTSRIRIAHRDSAQRVPEIVRNDPKNFISGACSPLRILIEPRIINRQRSAPSEVFRQVGGVVHASCVQTHQGQHADRLVARDKWYDQQ